MGDKPTFEEVQSLKKLLDDAPLPEKLGVIMGAAHAAVVGVSDGDVLSVDGYSITIAVVGRLPEWDNGAT